MNKLCFVVELYSDDQAPTRGMCISGGGHHSVTVIFNANVDSTAEFPYPREFRWLTKRFTHVMKEKLREHMSESRMKYTIL